MIAGLVKAPSNYSPTADADAAVGRAGVVIQQMVRNGVHHRRAGRRRRPRRAEARTRRRKQNSVRYFTDWALPQLDTLIDETEAPLEVWTTLDLGDAACRPTPRSAPTRRPARRARWSASTATARCGRWSAARDYVSSIYNRATQAARQPGSAFKLFVYLAALEAGHKPDDQVVDEPVTIDGWSPRNDFAPQLRRDGAANGLCLFDQHGRGEAGAGGRVHRPSPTWRAGSASPRPSTRIRRWCSAPPTCA